MNKPIDVSIIDVAARCGIRMKNTDRVEIPVSCPFCGDTKKHASLNTVKNLFHCFKCGEGHNAVTLFAKIIGADTKTAYRELAELTEENRRPAPEQEREPKPLHERHAVYTELLRMLSLSDKHREDLLRRGLDAPAVDRNQYRSVPGKDTMPRIAETLAKKYNLSGIPGFHTAGGKWRMSLKPGIFIPVRDIDGCVQGLMIRLDRTKTHKYEWFTSRHKENGTRAKAWLHVAGNRSNAVVYVTEGALKSDVAAYFNPAACYIGLPGVHCQNELAPLLERMGAKKIFEAFDMDKLSNAHVAGAAAELKRKLADAGVLCQSFTWDERFNGLDDYYQFCDYLDSAA